MADAQKTIDLIFNGVDRTGAATLSALDNARKFSGSIKDITAPVADFTLGAAKLEAGLLAAGVAMTVFSVKTAGDFDQSFSQIHTLFEASAEDTAKFKNDIFEYASTSSKSFEDVSGAVNAAIGQGVKWSEALDVVAVAEKLAVATRSDLTSTTTTLVGTLKSYGLSTQEIGKVSDMFFQTIKDGKVEMSELAKSFSMITPLANVAGVSLEELFSAIAVMTATGMPASQAIEYLRSTITNIIKPTKQASDLAAELGIQFDAGALKSKGLAGVLEDVSRATAGSAGQMNILIGDAGGMVAAALLAKNGAKELKDELILMSKSAGSVDEAFKIMSNAMDLVAQRVSNAFRAMTISIGTPLLEEFGGVADAIAKIFLALGNSAREGGLKVLVDYIETQMKSLEKSVQAVAANLPAALATANFSGFIGGVDAMIEAVKMLFGGLDLTSVEGLKAAVETMGAAFMGLSKYVAGTIEAFKPLFDTLVAVGRGAKDADLGFLEIAGSLGGLVTQINIAMPMFDLLIAMLAAKSGLGLVKELGGLATLLPALTSGLGLLAEFGALLGVGMGGFVVGGFINEGISALISKLTGSQTTLGGWVYDLIRAAEAAGFFGKKAADAANGVKDLGGAASNAQSDFRKSEIALQNTAAAADTAQQAFRKTEIAAQTSGDTAQQSFRKSEIAAQSAATAAKDVSKYTLETVPIYDKATGAITGYEQKLVASAKGTIDLHAANTTATGSLKKITEETDKAGEAVRKWNEELAKMAHEEKIKLIESQTKIATANIEADAKKAVAAFESIGVSIKSTGEVLSGLYGNMKNFDSMSWEAEGIIKKGIESETALRKDSFELQKRLTEAQIRMMNAQVDALQKGDGLIKIDGAGLKPHLEAFMWEILKAIQVKVNKDGLKLLLGV